MSKDHSATHEFTEPPADKALVDLFLDYLYDKAGFGTVLAHAVDGDGNMHAAVLAGAASAQQPVNVITALVKTKKQAGAKGWVVTLNYYSHPHTFGAALPPQSFVDLIHRTGYLLDDQLDDDWLKAVQAKQETNDFLASLPRDTLYRIKPDKFHRIAEGEVQFAYWGEGRKNPKALIPEIGYSGLMKPEHIRSFEPIPTSRLRVYVEAGRHIEMNGFLFTGTGEALDVLGVLAITEQKAAIAESLRVVVTQPSVFCSGEWLS